MPFTAVTLQMNQRTPWNIITHIRLVDGVMPDTSMATARWSVLIELADVHRMIKLEDALLVLSPVRTLDGNRERSIKYDLRCWANPKGHGNNSRDKGWLELGYLET